MELYQLTKVDGTKLCKVRFFEEFMSHYTEEDDGSDFMVRTYKRLGRSKEELIKEYQELGYAE